MTARAFLTLLLLTAIVPAAAQRPQINDLWPPAAQRGTTVACRIEGGGMQGATSVLVSGSGVSAKLGVAAGDGATVPVTFAVTGDADPGPHEVRIVTPRGVSTPGYFWIQPLKTSLEKEPNSRASEAMPLGLLPVALCARMDAPADVDWYSLRASAGDTMVVDVVANSIYSRLDPVLELLDGNGYLLAAANSGYRRDPRIVYTFRTAGVYRVQVRDTMYRGGPGYVYVLSVGRIPAIGSVFPPGGHAGESVDMRVEGANLGGMQTWKTNLPDSARRGEWWAIPETPGGPALPVRLAVCADRPAPPNVSSSPSRPYAISGTPLVVPGRILKPDQLDQFLMRADLPKPVTIRVSARELGSSLIPSLRVFDKSGKELANADDQAGRDPVLAFVPPAAGDYRIQVGNADGGAGVDNYYCLSVEPSGFRVSASPDVVALGPGQTALVTVNATRTGGFDGAIEVKAAALPPGVAASPLTIPPGESTGIITLTALASAHPTAAAIEILASAEVAGTRVMRTALAIADLPGPGEDQSVARAVAFRMAAVTDSAPLYALSVEPGEIDLEPGKSVTLKVRATRKAGDNAAQGAINIELSELPAGITAETPAIPEKQAESTIKLTAAADAKATARNVVIIGKLGEVAEPSPAFRLTIKSK